MKNERVFRAFLREHYRELSYAVAVLGAFVLAYIRFGHGLYYYPGATAFGLVVTLGGLMVYVLSTIAPVSARQVSVAVSCLLVTALGLAVVLTNIGAGDPLDEEIEAVFSVAIWVPIAIAPLAGVVTPDRAFASNVLLATPWRDIVVGFGLAVQLAVIVALYRVLVVDNVFMGSAIWSGAIVLSATAWVVAYPFYLVGRSLRPGSEAP